MTGLILLLAAALAAAPTAVIHGSAVNVRATPGTEAAVVARLGLNTEVRVLSTEGGWTRVALLGRPAEHPLEGWVHSPMLGEAPVDRSTLQQALEASVDPRERLSLAERVLALDPEDADSMDQLIGVARAAGHSGMAQTVESWRTQGRPVWVGSCGGGRAVLLGRFDAAGFHPLGAWDDRTEEALEEARRAGVQPWYLGYTDDLSGEDVVVPLEGQTVFPAPFVSPITNEVGESAWAPGRSELDDGARRVVLGPCQISGLITTSPYTVETPALLPTAEVWPRVARAADASGDQAVGGSAWRVSEGAELVEVRLRVPYVWSSCGGEGEHGMAEVYRVEKGNGEPVAGLRGGAGEVYLERVDASTWVSFPSRTGGPGRLLGRFDSQGGTWSQVVFVGVWGEAVFEERVVTEQGGC